MFLSSDFITKSNKIDELGSGTFGSVSLCNTPEGKHVIKETRTSDDCVGYPYDFLTEVDALVKLKPLKTVVGIEGVLFHDTKSKGYIMMEQCDTSLSKWAKCKSFNERINALPDLISYIGGTLAVMHSIGMIHNDIKGNNILVNEGPFFKLADFGKAKFPVDGKNGEYGCITRFESPWKLDVYQAEFWAFMVVLVEFIIGGRMIEEKHVGKDKYLPGNDDFYRKYVSGNFFELERYLKRKLMRDEFKKIPPMFWDFISPLISKKSTDIITSLKNINVEINDDIIRQLKISSTYEPSPLLNIVDVEFEKRLKEAGREFLFERWYSLINQFISKAGVPLSELDIKRYAEVAFVLVVKRKTRRLKYFNDENMFRLYQRAMFCAMGYQTIII